MSMKKRISKLEKQVAKQRPEVRNNCVEIGATSIGTTGKLIDLTALNGGTDNQDTRIGVQVKLLKLNMRYIITQASSSTYGGVYVRWILARSKSGPLLATDFPSSYYGCPDRDKYYVLEDRLTDLRAAANNGAGTNLGFTHEKVYADKSYKRGLTVRYDDDPAPSIDNGLYLFMWAQGTATEPRYAGYHNIQYYDA